jgi:hypothetical protein
MEFTLKSQGAKDVLESTAYRRTAGRHGNQYVRLRGAHLIYLPNPHKVLEPSVTARAFTLAGTRRQCCAQANGSGRNLPKCVTRLIDMIE